MAIEDRTPGASAAASGTKATPRASVLVVDDEPGIRDLLVQELGAEGYRVMAAADGQEALEKLRRDRFQLVISDISMPRMGGLELLRAVKGLSPDTEVIVSTGYGTVEAAVKAMKEGAYDFIQKPFELAEMLVLVQKALEKSETAAILAVYESSKAVFSSLELEKLLPVVARLSALVLKADDASVLSAGPGAGLVPASHGACGGDCGGKTCDGACEGELARECRALTGQACAPGSPPFIAELPGEGGTRSAIVCPLDLEGERLGALVACRRPGAPPFVPADLRPATIFGSLLALALRNATLYRRLEEKIEEVRRIQGRLVQSEKLAAIGQLAAGVAHEINNPLTSILGFAELLGPNVGPEQKADLDCVVNEAQRCRTIVSGLLQFGRRSEPRKEAVRLPALAETIARLARHELRKAGVELELDLPESLPPVHADPSQLQQVFLNMVTNARHALEGRPGARLRIAARGRAGRVDVRFEDNGRGIAPEHLKRLFEPFFTTKPAGKGTGLGLSICHGLIEQNGGSIEVESREGVGTTFVVNLPAGAERPGGST